MTKREFLFTVFTPVYNGEKFIHRVFDSLMKSTYRNFEWIIINDASTDHSDEIIRHFISDVDWEMVVSASLLAGILSILTSLGGLPEVKK